MENHNTDTILPVFKGYTIDSRLKEFRRIKSGALPEIIKFDSSKGSKLIFEITKQKPEPLISIPLGSRLSGKYLGSIPVDWPLSNIKYRQAALMVDNNAIFITLPIETIKDFRLGQTLTLTSTKQGITSHITQINKPKLKR